MTRTTTTTSARIYSDQLTEAQRIGLNLSEFFRKKLDEELDSPEFLQKREEELLEQLEAVRSKKGNFKKKTPEEYESDKKKFFAEAKKIISRNPDFLRGQWNRFREIFGDKISIDKFRELIQ
jgi:hypothetical protein